MWDGASPGHPYQRQFRRERSVYCRPSQHGQHRAGCAEKPSSRKVTKPSDGQAITVELSHDQPIKIDLTAIAGENVTLTRIGERLIILFDNRSTVTIEPYSRIR